MVSNASLLKDPGRWICGRLRALRVAKGIRQLAMADAVPCSRSYISKYEQGWVHPNLEHLIRLGEVLGVGIVDLLNPDILIEDLVTLSAGLGEVGLDPFMREIRAWTGELSASSRSTVLFAARSLSQKQLPLEEWVEVN